MIGIFFILIFSCDICTNSTFYYTTGNCNEQCAYFCKNTQIHIFVKINKGTAKQKFVLLNKDYDKY